MSDNPSIKERLASIETSLKILIRINNKDHETNNKDHEEIKGMFNDLTEKVNHEVGIWSFQA